MNSPLDNYSVDFVVDEIIDFIKDNLLLLKSKDGALIDIRKYCAENPNLTHTPYSNLLDFTLSSLKEFISMEHLYDFWDIE